MYKPVTNRWNKIHMNTSKPYFAHKGKIHYLDDFVRVHNNPWILDTYPENIHAYDVTEYYNPLFIEVNNDGSAVKIYEYKEAENESCM